MSGELQTTGEFQEYLETCLSELELADQSDRVQVGPGQFWPKCDFLASHIHATTSRMKNIAWSNRSVAREIWSHAEARLAKIMWDRFQKC